MFCDQCRLFWREATAKADIPEKIHKCEDVRWVAYETILHNTVRELKRASDSRCRICRIIFSTPTAHEHVTLLKDDDEPINIVLSIDPSKGLHPVLSAEFREAGSDDARILKRMVASCSGLLRDNDLARTIDRCEELPNDHTGSDGALELAAYWTRRCTESHNDCRSLAVGASRSFVPTRLVDAGSSNIRIIETVHELGQDADRRFVALSHCWGVTPIIQTLKRNYIDHRNEIDPQKLSKTFREAIYTTRKLGYRYIWIDSLCIIQDDGDDWTKEAATMCDVYQFATLTIAAAHAPGGDIGCFTYRDGLLQLPFYIELPGPDKSTTPVRVQFNSYGRISDVGGGDPALFGRAWVLQEQLLSPRMLMFDGIRLGWGCLSMHGSENSPTSGTTRQTTYHKFIRAGIVDDFEYFRPPKESNQEPQDHNFWTRLKHQYWCELVMDYTHRGMTKSKDRLVALAGIAKALNRHTNHEYWAGLWSQHFTIGLLWSITHNEKFLMPGTKGFDIEQNATVRHEQILAPSWSWVSVTTPVMYAETELLSYDSICNVLNVSVLGTINQQTGSATIRGHIRTGYLNPVYPYSIREAATQLPHMTVPPPTGRKGLEYVGFKGRVFHPVDYFLFSPTHPLPRRPNTKKSETSASYASKHGSFRLIRGYFRPDEVIHPCTQITFLAIAQQHYGSSLTSMLSTHDEAAALKVHTLALVPTLKAPNEYRRVGLAVWDQCAWYGYLCGWKDERDRRVYRPGNYSQDGYLMQDGMWDRVVRRLGWDDFEMEVGDKEHAHGYVKGDMPDRAKYLEGIEVFDRTVVIV